MEVGPVFALQIKNSAGRDFVGWTNPFLGQILHPSLVQSSRFIQQSQTVQLFLNRILILCRQFGCRTSLCFTDQETQEENLQDENSSLVGQFLHPISLVQSSRSIQYMQTVNVPKQNFYPRSAIWMQDQYMLHRSGNSERDFLVEPATLWASSYTHLLYKAQDLFSK